MNTTATETTPRECVSSLVGFVPGEGADMADICAIDNARTALTKVTP